MLLSNAPRKVALPFAENGEKNTIPEGSSPSAGFASMNDGFPLLTRQPVGSGGIPPQGLDMNGILYYLSSLNKWQSAGGSFVYDSTFATDSDVGGYPNGAILLRADGTGFWLNQADNNTTNPDTGGANWQPINNVGVTSKTLTGSDVTLTNAEASKDIIVLSGTLTTNVNLIMPVFPKKWIVANNTSGAFTVTVKTASGTGGLVTQGTSRVFYGDGTNVYGVNPLIASQAQVNTGTDTQTFLTPKTFKDSQQLADKADKNELADKADKNGNASNRFKVASAVDNDEAARKDQLPVQATDAIIGISREATPAEVLAGTLAGVFISPDNLSRAFPASNTTFQLSIGLPNGYIIKMGYTEYGELPAGVVTVPTTFTNQFPSDCLFALASPYNPNSSGQMAFICTMRSWADDGISVDMVELSGSGNQFDASYVWIAIGTA